MRRFGSVGLCICLLGAASSAMAQEPLRETITVTASASPVPFENLSRTVTVLTDEQIARLPVRSVAELLQYASSLDVQSRGPSGVQSDFSVRGAGFGQTLVLVDGVRINDSQTGHHNSDIPVLLKDIDRIEILYGPGSSLYGADAFGGTINIITKRKQKSRQASVTAGEYGLLEGSLIAGFEKGRLSQVLGIASSRSGGFMYDRDFQTLGLTSRTSIGEHSSLFVSHVGKEFGANGFYGPAPSREWTQASLVAFERRWTLRPNWDLSSQTYYRTHGDHFLYDIRQPGHFENFHRTHSAGGQLRLHHTVSENTKWTIGGDVGSDWLRSNSLGNHHFARTAVLAELQRKLGSKAVITAGARLDAYSKFGNSFNPSVGASGWLLPTVKLRAAAGHAFRVPSFTELYYHDPNHQASPGLKPEQAWGVETGADWLFHTSWIATFTVFSRSERDVIDWVRETARQQWRTVNLRHVDTQGLEFSLQRHIPAGKIEVQYTYLSSAPGPIPYLSKYVSDYARHSWSGFASVTLPGRLELGPRLGFKRRVEGREYWVWDTRIGRSFDKFHLYLEGSNLTNTQYQEVRGVDMPGRWLRAGLELRGF